MGHFARLGFNEGHKRDHAGINEPGQEGDNHEKPDEGRHAGLRWLKLLWDKGAYEASARCRFGNRKNSWELYIVSNWLMLIAYLIRRASFSRLLRHIRSPVPAFAPTTGGNTQLRRTELR